MGELYIGDNLDIFRLRYIAEESVDLVYLDPPFKSNRDYNMLFLERDGTRTASQQKAFNDTWRWNASSALTCESMGRLNDAVGQAIRSLYQRLGPSDMMAYLAMMAPRLVELRRLLKPTGSIYLHCDPTASHYLKMLMDAVFEPRNFRNEIVWKRFSAKNDPRRYGRSHDVIFFYSKTDRFQWFPQHGPFEVDYVRENYRYVEPETNRRYRLSDLTAAKPGGDVNYEWHGMRPYRGRHWAFSRANMDRFLREGRIVFRRTGMPVYKRFLDEQKGVPLQDVWTDIKLEAGSKERVGYPTQKPAALLRRILLSSTKEGDLVLDPFCGCGTAVVVAEQLNRRWIGIDIADLARTVIHNRFVRDVGRVPYPTPHYEPSALAEAIALAKSDRKHFETWALGLVGNRPERPHQGGDRGVDGRIFDGLDRVGIVSVKSGGTGPRDVRDLRGTVEGEDAAIGILISLVTPTRAMLKAAADAGVYATPTGPVSRIQVLTIAELFAGLRPIWPPRDSTLQRLPRAAAPGPSQAQLPLLTTLDGGRRGIQLPIAQVESEVPWRLAPPPGAGRRAPSRRAASQLATSPRRRRRRSSA